MCTFSLPIFFFYSYECEWVCKKVKNKEHDILEKLKYCFFCFVFVFVLFFRYIDDLLCINNDPMMDNSMKDIYPQLSLTSDDEQAIYLDLSIAVKNGKIHTSLFDKRDTFGSLSWISLIYLETSPGTKLWCFCVTTNPLLPMLSRPWRLSKSNSQIGRSFSSSELFSLSISENFWEVCRV